MSLGGLTRWHVHRRDCVRRQVDEVLACGLALLAQELLDVESGRALDGRIADETDGTAECLDRERRRGRRGAFCRVNGALGELA
jgi:hypothetical protein